ncbi:MAG: ATP-binding cassette domain-containing protein [Hydrogeniiclostridium mannosilyticum]
MIEVKGLTKRYGANIALDHISFSVEQGTIVGFLGPNGAGKSTTMNIITGYLSASSGSVSVGGHNILEEPSEVKKLIGYLPEIPPLYTDMTVKEYLNFMYDLKKVTLPREKHLKEICDLVRINEVYGRLIGTLSKGYRQRVGIAQALGQPAGAILDEPTVGLDPKQIIEIRNLIKNLGRNHTIILSSHILPEVQAVCERVLVINKGRIVADGTPDSLSHNLSSDHRLIVRIEGLEKDVLANIKTLKDLVEVVSYGEKEANVCEYSIEGKPGRDLRRDLFALCSRKGMPILALRNTDLSLEDVFLRLTSESYSGPAIQPEEKAAAREAVEAAETAPQENSEEGGDEE